MRKERLRSLRHFLYIMDREENGEAIRNSLVNEKEKIATRGGSENFYNIGYTDNTISPRGPKTYRYE